jgi:hypothetical protein
VLSNPAEQYPSVFGKVKFFKDYPYALPTFTAGAIGFSAVIISALFIKEVCLFLLSSLRLLPKAYLKNRLLIKKPSKIHQLIPQ